MKAIRRFGALAIVACLACAGSVSAQGLGGTPAPSRGDAGAPASEVPRELANVGFDQKLDAQMPADAVFRDETGRSVRLGDYFGRKPIVFVFVYFTCPMLCTQVLTDVTSALGVLTPDVGKDFDVVALSFDPRDTAEMAAEKKAIFVERYKRPGTETGWHYLTGDEANIRRVTGAAGFRYRFDPVTNQFAHAAGVLVLTPSGRISRVFYGLEYAPKDLRLALVESSEGKIGTPADMLLLYCYHYDPATGRYGLMAMNLVRLGGGVTVVVLGAFLLVMWRRERRSASGTGV